MSKKVVPFALPQMRQAETAGEPPRAARDDPSQASDIWVFDGQAEPVAEAAPPLRCDAGLVIDLCAKRSAIEWTGLIWAFPYLATRAWAAQVVRAYSNEKS